MACSVTLEGTSVREPLRHPSATLGILESGNLDGTCEPGLLSQDLSALKLSGGSHTGELAMIWRVLGIFLSAQSDAGALTSLSALVHRDLGLLLGHTDELQQERNLRKYIHSIQRFYIYDNLETSTKDIATPNLPAPSGAPFGACSS